MYWPIIYAYVGNNPVSFVDPSGLLSSGARRLVDNAMAGNCNNVRAAHGKLMEERVKRNWEAISQEGKDLRDAENYLTNYEFVSTGSGFLLPVRWFVFGVVAAPVWQAKRLGENLMGESTHSPASIRALTAG